MRRYWHFVWIVTLLSAGCGEEGQSDSDKPGGASDAGVPADVAFLTPAQHLTRASIALRGLRPSVEELKAVREDARYVEAIVDYYLNTPEFGVTVRELHEEALLSGVDPAIYPAGFPAIRELGDKSLQEINQSIVEAPLRLIEHVVMTDRPYSEIVTADYGLADDVVATVWGMTYDDKGPRWQESRYEDGRPTAGILSDSFLFTRHSTTFSNKSRGRANMVSRALLCYDFLSKEIPLDSSIDLADPEAVADAVTKNPACLACHQTLDPLASFFASYRPIYVPSDTESFPFRFFTPAFREAFSVTDPSYFGQQAGDIVELGQRLAKDDLFSLCAAKRFYSHLSQVDLGSVPSDLATELQSALVDSDMNAKELAKAVVMSNAFRASHGKTDAAAENLVGLLKVGPTQLGRMVERLTGYRWQTNLPIELGTGPGQVGHVDLMNDALFGFKVLAGGIDSQSVVRPSRTMSATVTLAVEGLAARAANYVVDEDFKESDLAKRRLLTKVSDRDTGDVVVAEQIAELQLRLYGEFAKPTDEAVQDGVKLFFAALSANDDDAKRAWKVTLYAMLQDARLLYY